MNKNAKQPSNVKKKHDVDKHLQGGGQTGTVRPAEKIADDELEIGRTGGKARNEEYTYNRTQALTMDR